MGLFVLTSRSFTCRLLSPLTLCGTQQLPACVCPSAPSHPPHIQLWKALIVYTFQYWFRIQFKLWMFLCVKVFMLWSISTLLLPVRMCHLWHVGDKSLFDLSVMLDPLLSLLGSNALEPFPKVVAQCDCFLLMSFLWGCMILDFLSISDIPIFYDSFSRSLISIYMYIFFSHT